MTDLAVERALYPSPEVVQPDAEAWRTRALRAESEARGLRAELGALRVERNAVALARDWWMKRAAR